MEPISVIGGAAICLIILLSGFFTGTSGNHPQNPNEPASARTGGCLFFILALGVLVLAVIGGLGWQP